MSSALFLVISGLLAGPASAEELPPAPERPRPEPATQPDDPPQFGADASLGYGVGALLGPWPTSGAHGHWMARYDAFTASREQGGPRLGLGIWATGSLWPLQEAVEDDLSVEVRYLHYGVMSVLRHDPAAPFSATTGIGFGRLDMDNYWGGPLALPTLSFEAGLRQSVTPVAFVDWTLRGHWSTARSGAEPTLLEEWWMVGFSVSLGAHLR